MGTEPYARLGTASVGSRRASIPSPAVRSRCAGGRFKQPDLPKLIARRPPEHDLFLGQESDRESCQQDSELVPDARADSVACGSVESGGRRGRVSLKLDLSRWNP